MAEIGFVKKGTRHLIHSECKHLFVEFPGGPPLGIGEDYTIIPDEIESEGVKIKILSPTDCVKDRLVFYNHFKTPDWKIEVPQDFAVTNCDRKLAKSFKVLALMK